MSYPLVVNKRTTSQFDVYIGRPSEWGNHFTHRGGTTAEHVVGSRDEAVEAYRKHLWHRIKTEGEPLIFKLAELHGKRLACWCAPLPCHGDVLTKAAAWAAQEALAIHEADVAETDAIIAAEHAYERWYDEDADRQTEIDLHGGQL